MAKSAKHLLIASTEAHSGKSATILGLSYLSSHKDLSIGYGQPLGTDFIKIGEKETTEDVNFLASTLGLPAEKVKAPLIFLDRQTIDKRLAEGDREDYSQALKQYVDSIEADLVLLEGPNNLWEGSLFNLSVLEIADCVDASILLIVRYHPLAMVASLIAAKKFLGDRLIGIVVNEIPRDEMETVTQTIQPYLEKQGIPVLGTIPKDRILNSISVKEIATRLDAKVLCCEEHLDWMVESLSIGAMNVNSALGYFRQRDNMAVITGGDRAELQMAALETSTHCLILTGQIPPKDLIIERAQSLDIPILSVDTDTLTTVEIIDGAFGKVPIYEPIKIKQIQSLMEQHFDIDRLLDTLDIAIPTSV